MRGRSHSLGADCVEKEMRDRAPGASSRELLEAAGIDGRSMPADFRRYGSARKLYHFHVDNVGTLLRWQRLAADRTDPAARRPRESATFDATSIAEIRRAAATGIYDIRGFGAKRKLPHFDDLLFLGASRLAAIRWRATARNAPPT